MKYYTRLKLYKASNVIFKPSTCEAYSYDWWKFVSVINGLVVFNNYTYSNSTAKHQSKVRCLLNTLGISIDAVVEAPKGLQDLASAVPYYQTLIRIIQAQIDKPKSKAKTNDARRKVIIALHEKIAVVNILLNKVVREDSAFEVA